jgi:hypothetical protein
MTRKSHPAKVSYNTDKKKRKKKQPLVQINLPIEDKRAEDDWNNNNNNDSAV